MCDVVSDKYLKEYDINRDVLNLMGFYVSNLEEEEKKDVVKVFNGWARWSGIKFSECVSVALALEHIRKLCKIRKEDLEKAVLFDHISFRPINQLHEDF